MTDDLGVPDADDVRRQVELHRPAADRRRAAVGDLQVTVEARAPVACLRVGHGDATGQGRIWGRTWIRTWIRSERVIVHDRAGGGRLGERGIRRAEEEQRKGLTRFGRGITADEHRHRFLGFAGGERERAGSGRIVAADDRSAVGRGISDRHRLRARGRERNGKGKWRGRDHTARSRDGLRIALGDGKIADRDAGGRHGHGHGHRAVIMATGLGLADRCLGAVGDLAHRGGRRQQR